MRRAQVTYFVIIGLVVLIVVALLIMLVQRRMNIEPIRTVPAEFEPVRQHVLSCMRIIGTDAVHEVARKGGYLSLDEISIGNENLVIDPDNPTGSDAVIFNPADGGSAVPYYLYLRGNEISSLVPSVETVERGLATYIQQRLPDCLNFGAYPDFVITPSPAFNASVVLYNESFVVMYDRVVEMQKGTSTATIEQFVEELEIPLGRYRNIAIEIAGRELANQYLERFMLYIISTYGGINQELPPTAGFEESFVPKFWVQSNVERDYQQLLYALTPNLRVAGAKGVMDVPPQADAYVQGFLDMTLLPIVSQRVDDIEVSFHYLNQPIDLDVRPRAGELIKPRTDKISGYLFMPPRQNNYYNFFYDVSAPFVVELHHEANAMDFTFLFALEGNLIDNKNVLEWLTGNGTIPWDPNLLTVDIIDQPSPVELNRIGFTHNVTKPLLCDKHFRTSPTFAIVEDRLTGRPLANVSFAFRCGFYASCPVGTSERSEFGQYALDTMLPPCTGGLLRAERDGYATIEREVTTQPNRQSTPVPTIQMWPYVEKNITFVKYIMRRTGFGPPRPTGPYPLTGGDYVQATIKRETQLYGEHPHSVSLFANATERSGPVLLTPGRYSIEALYYNNDGYTIPAKCEEYCWDETPWNPFDSDECVAMPEDDIEIKPAPWGGLSLGGGSGLSWYIPDGLQLYRAREIIIPVFVGEPPRCIEDLERMGLYPEWTESARFMAYPQMR